MGWGEGGGGRQEGTVENWIFTRGWTVEEGMRGGDCGKNDVVRM